jgi:hypothetical protein
MALGLVIAASTLFVGCFRDGYQCATDADCFGDEQCRAGACATVAGDACRPESDADLCAAASPCQPELEVVDACGELRTVDCDCTDACTPETIDVLCDAVGATCGAIEAVDSCGDDRTVNCGLCEAPETCIDNACAACPPPQCDADAQCGQATNACGDSVDCPGVCASGEVCVEQRCTSSIIAPDALVPGERFGEAIAFDGDELVVGAPYADYGGVTRAGRVYVYQRDGAGFSRVQVIEDVSPENDGRFGQVLDVRDGRLAIGVGDRMTFWRRTANGQYTFALGSVLPARAKAAGWMPERNLLVGFDDTGDRQTLWNFECSVDFQCSPADYWDPPNIVSEVERLGVGFSIATADNFAAVGAPYDNLTQSSDFLAEGSLYLLSTQAPSNDWDPSGWTSAPGFYQYISPDDFENASPLGVGTSVAISADGFAVAGAPDSSVPEFANNIGEVYFLAPLGDERFSWPERYIGFENQAYGNCGRAVGLGGPAENKLAFVSCLYPVSRAEADQIDSFTAERTIGTVHRYSYEPDRRAWDVINDEALRRDDASLFDHYGWSIETSDTELFVGAPGLNDDRGAVYFFPIAELLP